MGLVAYRDKGDEYITKVIDLTDDLDAIHGHLKKFVASGGGDEPEHVNQALHDAVHKIKWSTDKKTLRIIFLVGDAPPHMDYNDDVKYPETCKKAVEKGIIINTIQCGNGFGLHQVLEGHRGQVGGQLRRHPAGRRRGRLFDPVRRPPCRHQHRTERLRINPLRTMKGEPQGEREGAVDEITEAVRTRRGGDPRCYRSVLPLGEGPSLCGWPHRARGHDPYPRCARPHRTTSSVGP